MEARSAFKTSWAKSVAITIAMLVATGAIAAFAGAAGSPYASYRGGDIAENDAFMGVVTSNGKTGYVEVEKYDFATRSEPLKRKPTERERRLPVYDETGRVIGEFIIPESS